MQRPVPLLPPVSAPLKAIVAQAATQTAPRERAAVMACWMVARLAVPRLPRESDVTAAESLQLRAEATRRWLDAQPLPPAVAFAAARACDAAGDRDPALLADPLDALRDAADALLNDNARAEMTTLAQLLRRTSLAAMR